MAKLQWLGWAAWATVEDKWTLCSFVVVVGGHSSAQLHPSISPVEG